MQWYPGVVSSLEPLLFCPIDTHTVSTLLAAANARIETAPTTSPVPASVAAVPVVDDVLYPTALLLCKGIVKTFDTYLRNAFLQREPRTSTSTLIAVASWQTRPILDWSELYTLLAEGPLPTVTMDIRYLPPAPVWPLVVHVA